MSDQDDYKQRSQRMPPWAGYLLIAMDTLTKPLFLVPWLGTMIAVWLVLPTASLWLAVAALVLVSIACIASITRAVTGQASQQGVLGAYVAHLASDTALGRWLTDWLTGPKSG